jgi:hypothetical protein
MPKVQNFAQKAVVIRLNAPAHYYTGNGTFHHQDVYRFTLIIHAQVPSQESAYRVQNLLGGLGAQSVQNVPAERF